MKLRPIHALILAACLYAPLAWPQEGAITTPEQISATKLRPVSAESQFPPGGEPYMVLTIAKLTDTGEVVDTIVVQVRNGSGPANQWLDGTGMGGQPVGIETEIGSAIQPACDPATDGQIVRCQSALGRLYSGQPLTRKGKAVMRWLAVVGRPAILAGAEGITAGVAVPEFTEPSP